MKKETVLVVGASGTVGSEIVRQLQTAGIQVRQTTSREANPAAQKFKVDLATGEGVKSAFTGVDRAFLISPPGYADQYALLAPLIQEAKRQGLKKVVLMTALGANANESAPFRRAEIELEKSGLNYNIIRPNWFMQNFNTFWLQGLREFNKILLPAGRAKVSFMDARDIASVAVKLLTEDQDLNKAFDLTGGESHTHEDVANVLSLATGKTFSYQEIKPEEFKSGLLNAGLPKDYVEFLVMIMGYLREGYNAEVLPTVKELLGRDPISLKKYAEDFKSSWL